MAKRKKSINDGFGNPVNRTKDLNKQIVTGIQVYDAGQELHVGVLVLETLAGHYQFFVGEPAANDLIKALQDFVAGNAKELP